MNETFTRRATEWMESEDPYHRAICGIALKTLEMDRAYYEYGADAEDEGVEHPNKGGRLSRAITAMTDKVVADFPDHAGNVGRHVRAMVQALYEVKAQLPREFYREDDGLICIPGNKAGPKPICSDIRIVAETRHIGDKRNGVVVEVFDHQKGWTEVQYDKRDLYGAGDQWLQPFLDAGLIPESGRNADVKALLVQATSSKIIAVAERPGWATIDGKMGPSTN